MAGGQYIDVDGLRTYFEVCGEGDDLLLLHGGFETVETLELQARALARRFRVHLPERRGHGRTPDVDGPFTYDAMTADTIAFMAARDLARAHTVGYSDGAIIGLLMAIRHPERVRSLVAISGNTSPEGLLPMEELMAAMPKDAIQAMRDAYDRLSPDGAHHRPVVRDKIMRMWSEEPHLSAEELGTIRVPALVMAGDRDVVSLEHTVAMYRAIPGAQLCIVPDAGHLLTMERAEPVNRVLLDFLAGVA